MATTVHGNTAGGPAPRPLNTCDKCAAGPKGCFHKPNNLSVQKHFTLKNNDAESLNKYRLEF